MPVVETVLVKKINVFVQTGSKEQIVVQKDVLITVMEKEYVKMEHVIVKQDF